MHGFPGAGFRGGHEVNPEDLFNFLFTGGMGGMRGGGGPGFRTHTFHFGGPGGAHFRRGGRGDDDDQPNRGRQQQGGFFQQLMQFLPVILMLLMSFNSFSSSGNQPMYSFKPSPNYKTAMR